MKGDFNFSPVIYAAQRVHLDPVNALGEADCALHSFPDRYGRFYSGSVSELLLEHTMRVKSWE